MSPPTTQMHRHKRRAREHSRAPIAAQLNTPQLLAIAASTGGPAALQKILLGLGADFRLPTLVTQHIAQLGETLLPGHVYLAPDEQHLLADTGGLACLRPSTASDRYCPSADLL